MIGDQYIDGFAFPLSRKHIKEYKLAAKAVAEIWKEHGALSYNEYIGQGDKLEGTLSFAETIKTHKDEVVVFGWVAFPSVEVRNLANERVASDPRIAKLVAPITDPNKLIFDSRKMIYGGFKSFIRS